jgi:serine/threonine-protein kinase
MESGKIVVGKYRLNQLLGTGGMAEVWSATNTFTERQIAIKFMNPQVAKTPDSAARFLKEAKVSARVNHPNVIEILDVGQTEDGQLFLVMELLTGISLEVALRRQNPPMTLYEFALVMAEVAGALAAAHKSGIVHRDLKPTNIVLHKVREGVAVPKLLDFGVSKFLEDDQNHALTIAGTVLGSPLYMSPEQARGDGNLDGRTDIFAFGAILFEALCGYRAYEAKNFNALIVKIATTKPKNIDECAPSVPESFRRIVRACMETSLDKRISSFEEVGAMLRQAMPELEASPARLPPPRIATAVVDPDATNALPVLRASDRPPPMPGTPSTPVPGSIPPPPPEMQSQSRSGSIPPGAIAPYGANAPTGPSWNTPNHSSYASITMRTQRPQNHTWIFAAAAGAIAVLAIAGTGLGLALRARAPARPAPITLADNPARTETTSATTTRASDPAPTPGDSVSVDSLPGARNVGPVAKGNGRLLVAAAPGWCTITIDGKERGPTPVPHLDLAAGPHQIECKAPSGKTRTATVTVQEGATSRYRFVLDE